MSSIKERQQRAAARAKLEREMAARREAAARRRKRLWISLSAGAAVIVLAAGVAIAVSVINNGDDTDTSAAPAPNTVTCTWNPVGAEERTPTTVDVGMPPTSAPNTGRSTMTVTTNFGAVNVVMDRTKSPCAVDSFTYLASKNFFDGTKCHRMFPGMLQCGDPSAKGEGYRETDGTGGPAYRYGNEYLPTTDLPAYPAGVVALANSGSEASNGSQFFFIYEDVELSPDYTILGKVDAAGLEVLKKATEKGHDGAFDPSPGGGHPKNDINIQTLTVAAS